MEKNELQNLIDRLKGGERIVLYSRVLTIDGKIALANYLSNNLDDYCNNEYKDDESVLCDAIDTVEASDDDWMFDKNNSERRSIW